MEGGHFKLYLYDKNEKIPLENNKTIVVHREQQLNHSIHFISSKNLQNHFK